MKNIKIVSCTLMVRGERCFIYFFPPIRKFELIILIGSLMGHYRHWSMQDPSLILLTYLFPFVSMTHSLSFLPFTRDKYSNVLSVCLLYIFFACCCMCICTCFNLHKLYIIAHSGLFFYIQHNVFWGAPPCYICIFNFFLLTTAQHSMVCILCIHISPSTRWYHK